jgi:hypothetical protein
MVILVSEMDDAAYWLERHHLPHGTLGGRKRPLYIACATMFREEERNKATLTWIHFHVKGFIRTYLKG